MADSSWTERYLQLLGLSREQPGPGYLKRLTEAHLHCFPFELVSKYHYYANRFTRKGLIPDREEFLGQFAERGWGGNCYILNGRFGELLRELGFDVSYVRARGGNDHLGIMADAGEGKRYVDVGYMAPLFEPLELAREPHLVRCGEEIIIRRESDREFVIDRRTGGQSFVVKTIEWEAVPLDSFEEAIRHAHRDEDENPFMRRMVAVLYKDRVCYQAVNTKLLVKSDRETKIYDYADRQEWLRMMESVFGLKRQDLLGVLEFLSERGVELFAHEGLQ